MPIEQVEILADEHAACSASSSPPSRMSLCCEATFVVMEQRVKDQLTIRVGSMLAAAVAIIAALVKLL